MSDLNMDQYALPGLMTMAGFFQCGKIALAVGKARGQYKVTPPASTGPDGFNRVFRAQQNHLEFYPLATGALWMGSVFFHPAPASLLYGGFLYGRYKYFTGYAEDSEKRIPGFKMSVRFLKMMWMLALLGVGHKLVRHVLEVDLLDKIKDVIPALD